MRLEYGSQNSNPGLWVVETPMEVDGFLKSHGVYLDYTEETLEEDLATNRRVSSHHRPNDGRSKCLSG